MAETTQRVLKLLGLLEARTTWRAAELSEKLGVTHRTVRRDISRLRDLGYPIDSEPGIDGGYRLGSGRQLPPLLLDDDEAVALVACLRMAALSGADDVGEAGLRALNKIDHVLPPKLRSIAAAINTATYAIPRNRSAINLDTLQQLATAQRDHVIVRFNYCKPDGETSSREVEPARLMTQGKHWYLQAFDLIREDWRVFRLDRMSDVKTSTWTFSPRDAPSPGFQRDLASRYPCVLPIEIEATVKQVVARVHSAHRDQLEPTATGSRLLVGGPNWDELAWHMLWVSRDLDATLTLPNGPEATQFREALARISKQAHMISAL